MSLYELQTPDSNPMIIGGAVFGSDAAERLQEELNDAGHEATVYEFDASRLERVQPIASLAVKQSG